MTVSKIEWCDRSDWNPIRGCTRESEGCRNCYAERIASRFSDPGQAFHGIAERTKSGPRWTGKMQLVEDRIALPLRWRKPARIFVNSMFDLFAESVPDEWIDRVFAVMALAPTHTFLVLTKRAKRMHCYLSDLTASERVWDRAMENAPMNKVAPASGARQQGPAQFLPWPLRNVWLGVSVEDQERADERIPELLATPAALHWISAEPLLGPVVLRPDWLYPAGSGIPPLGIKPWNGAALRHVIVGGESGPGARPMRPDWARSLRDQCAAAGVPYFFKQWGQFIPESCAARDHQGAHTSQTFGKPSIEQNGEIFWNVGKSRAGRLLDGREHSEFPHV